MDRTRRDYLLFGAIAALTFILVVLLTDKVKSREDMSFSRALDTVNIGTTANDGTGDPLFVSTSDFHLQAESPAINAGLSVGLTSDFAGHRVPQQDTVDIGAYEYGDYLFRTPSGKLLRNANGKFMITH